MRYDVLLFDADNTIFDFDACERTALAFALSQHGVSPTSEIISTYHAINARYWHLLSLDRVSKEDLYVLRFRDLFADFDIDADPVSFNATYRDALGERHVLLDGAAELLRSLHDRCAIYVVTNGHYATQRKRIAASNIAPYISDVFISDEIGYEKPDKRFFDFVVQRIPDFESKRAVIIGDSIDTDVRGAVEYGIDSIWFCPQDTHITPAYAPTYTARSFSEIYDILTK